MLCLFILKLNLSLSLVLGALAATTASASTIMTIRQFNAKGDFVNTLLQVVALDNVFGLVAYSMAISVAVALQSGSFKASSILMPIALNLAVLLLGGLFGLFFKAFDAETAFYGQSFDYHYCCTVQLLRHLRPFGCFSAFGLYVYGE